MDLVWLTLVSLPLCDPPLADRNRFPPQPVAAGAMQLNRAYRKQVERWRWSQLHQQEYWDQVLQETDYLYHCWDWLHAAQGGEGRDDAYWRYSLHRLRDLVGEPAYQAGAMPPPVPIWRFRNVD